MVEGVSEQAARFTHTCFMVTPYEGYVEVCEELARRTPGDHDKRSILVNSGAEAVENAVKIARHATGRQAVVAFDHAYHGRTNLTMALTAKNMPYKHRFGPFANEVYRVPMTCALRWPGGPMRCAAEALDVITGLIHTQVGEQNVAAVIIEPIQGEVGSSCRRPASCPSWPSSAGRTASCSSPTRSRADSAAPVTGSRARTRVWFPTWSPRPRASRAGCRWPA